MCIYNLKCYVNLVSVNAHMIEEMKSVENNGKKLKLMNIMEFSWILSYLSFLVDLNYICINFWNIENFRMILGWFNQF